MQNSLINRRNGRRISVLVVDDSALMRQMLRTVLDSDPDIEVVGAAPDPLCARQMIKDLDPDVVTLDVEMPKMDGLAFLEKLMTLRPMPAIMVSSMTHRGAEITMRALELGAVDFVTKPKAPADKGLAILKDELVPKVKLAAGARVVVAHRGQRPSPKPRASPKQAGRNIIAVGASTGGVAALRSLLSGLPATCPPVLITQHMPPAYTGPFAARLDQNSALTVTEAVDGQRIQSGHAYVAPGGRHLRLVRDRQGLRCHLTDDPLVSGHRPSVDVLFQSVAESVGAYAVGVILTGMGRDGAEGLLEMRQAGATTFGQSEASCVVYGMPRAALEVGAVEVEMPLDDMAKAILQATDLALEKLPIP